jgi:hypothetical protein
MNHVDPISKKEIPVKSVYIPTKTLLQGKPYTRANDVLVRTINKFTGYNDKR